MGREIVNWQPARLRTIQDLTADIRLFEIEPARRPAPPSPGSNISIMVQAAGRPDVRSYSIVGPCPDGVLRIAVKHLPDSRGGSAYMHTLQPGAQLTISDPGNHFELARNRPEYKLIAGGIGITPIYTMALALAEAEAAFSLLYACRGPADAAFARELRERIGDRLRLFFDADGQRIDLVAEIARLDRGGELYVCGPIGMLEAAKRAWQASGRPVDGLRFETFGNSGRYAAEPFTISIPQLCKEVAVARNQTMLEALEAAGVDMIFDCRRGECGLCAVKILAVEGMVDHRDVFFSDAQKAENRALCTCVSRVSGGRITVATADKVAA